MSVKIKYEQLSTEIREEIEKYHEKLVMSGLTESIEESMKKWFETTFDQWINHRFAEAEKNIRRHHRIDIEIPIRVVDTLIEPAESEDPDLDLMGTVINISRGGLFFKSAKIYELSSIVQVIIDMSKIDPDLGQISAIAMVVRCEQIETGVYGIGLMFSSIYDEHRQTFDLFIFKNLAYFLYK
jgi:hypothetical protein